MTEAKISLLSAPKDTLQNRTATIAGEEKAVTYQAPINWHPLAVRMDFLPKLGSL